MVDVHVHRSRRRRSRRRASLTWLQRAQMLAMAAHDDEFGEKTRSLFAKRGTQHAGQLAYDGIASTVRTLYTVYIYMHREEAPRHHLASRHIAGGACARRADDRAVGPAAPQLIS